MFTSLRSLALFAFVISLSNSNSVQADLLWHKLPEDGEWVTFLCLEKYADGTQRKLWITLKSVGRENIEGTPGRWIELKYQNEEARAAQTGSVMKFLIPEKELIDGGDPFGHVKSAWRLTPDEQPAPISDVAPLRHRLNLVISPPIKGLRKTNQKKIIEGPQGKLRCTVWQGSVEYELEGDTIKAKYSIGQIETAPTGVAWAKIELESSPFGTGMVTYSLSDFGHDAVSDFPNAKQ